MVEETIATADAIIITIAHIIMGAKTTAITAIGKMLAKQRVKKYVKLHVRQHVREQQNRIADAIDHFLTHHIRF